MSKKNTIRKGKIIKPDSISIKRTFKRGGAVAELSKVLLQREREREGEKMNEKRTKPGSTHWPGQL